MRDARIDVMVTHGHAIHVDEELMRGLEELAKARGADVEEVAAEALRDYVDYTRRFLASVEAGLQDAREGRVHTTDEVRAQLEARRKARRT